MAKKIRQANEKKMLQLKSLSTLQNCPSIEKQSTTEAKPEDWTSVQGQFGWSEIGTSTIPYLTRSGERYVSLRMAENKIFARYKNFFTDEIRSCFRVKILHVTSAETQLLNEINFRHCDNFYGRLEFTMSDGIVSYRDFTEMYDFLNFCHLTLIEKVTVPQNRCGFVKIAAQNCVPYVLHGDKQYVPLFYFEGECSYLEERSTTLSGWDLAYLKLYCKIQGIRKELYDLESVRVVEMELVKKFFPPDTPFEETWPADYNIDGLVQRPMPKLVFSQAQNKNKVQSSENAKSDQDSTRKKIICVGKNVPVLQKDQLSVAPVINHPKQDATAPTALNNVRLIQTTPKSTTLPTNTLQILNSSNQHVPAIKNYKVPIPNTPLPKTVPAPNNSDYQTTFAYCKSGPPAVNSNNFPDIRQTFPARHLSTPSTYQRGSRILQIPEVTCTNAYFVVRAQVEDKFFCCCINMEPFVTAILLVSLEEITSFFQLPLDLTINAVNVMNIDIFLPNRMQKKELEKFKVCSTRGLLKLREFIDNLPQLRYILDKTKNFDYC